MWLFRDPMRMWSSIIPTDSVVDISDPTSPTMATDLLDSTNLDGPAAVKVVGNYAYVAGYMSDSLAIVDVSNPTSITKVGRLKRLNTSPSGDRVVNKAADEDDVEVDEVDIEDIDGNIRTASSVHVNNRAHNFINHFVDYRFNICVNIDINNFRARDIDFYTTGLCTETVSSESAWEGANVSSETPGSFGGNATATLYNILRRPTLPGRCRRGAGFRSPWVFNIAGKAVVDVLVVLWPGRQV
ncbi:unnamed protein product [Symbiodinium sp. CCMP2456]|nr:unnamed protein product [Symbiodinium sp. CCMP2456]